VICLSDGSDSSQPLVDAAIELAFSREPICACVRCLTVQRGTAMLVPGNAVARAGEALAQAAEEGRLAAEVMRLARDPQLWMIARVPAIHHLSGFRVGAHVRVVADMKVAVERRMIRDREEGEAHAPRNYAVLQRVFRGARGEESDLTVSWQWGPENLPAGAAMRVLALEPPALVLEPQEAWMQMNSMPKQTGNLKTFRVYADAVAPFDVQ
jgi:hypothetical protein